MPGPGGKREGAGRPPGAVNKATRECRELAQTHAPAAMAELVRLATSAENEAVRKAACDSILDRAFGKPKQQLEHMGEDGGPMMVADVSSIDLARRVAALLRQGD